jgi:hypothetical protein
MSGGLPRPQGHPLGSWGESMVMVWAIAMGDTCVHPAMLTRSVARSGIDAHHESETWSEDRSTGCSDASVDDLEHLRQHPHLERRFIVSDCEDAQAPGR